MILTSCASGSRKSNMKSRAGTMFFFMKNERNVSSDSRRMPPTVRSVAWRSEAGLGSAQAW